MSQNPLSLLRLNAILSVFLLCAGPAWAQDNSAFGIMQPIVVSPTGFATPPDEIGSTVSIITSDQIERQQQRSLADALREVPGLNVVRTGGEGSTATVFIRGTDSNHTKILVDGIDANDPSTVNGAFDFSQILTSDIERIEVLRGPQSGLYGSDAIGGVIDIITKQGSGPPKYTAMAEGGSFGTFNQSFGVSGSQGRVNYAFDAAHLHYSDLPVTPSDLLGPGQAAMGDAFGAQHYSTKLGVQLTDNVSASLVARYANSLLRLTGENYINYPADVPDSTQSVLRENRIFARGAVTLRSFDDAIENEFGISYGRFYTNSNSVDPPYFGAPVPAPTVVLSDRVDYDWKGTAHLGGDRTVLLGIESKTDRLINSPIIASTTTHSGFAEYHTPVIGALFLTASGRVDDSDAFGRAVTWRLAPAYFVPTTGTQLKASYGTGFKAPTLQQLFVNYPGTFPFNGNPALQPETSRGYDAGFEQTLLDKKIDFGATYFHNNIHDLIQATFVTYENAAEATTYGAETFFAVKPVERVELRADYTYTVARDDAVGSELLRRPKNKASLNATWTPTDPLSLTASWLFVGARFDITRDGSPACPTEQAAPYNGYDCYRANSYSVVNLAADYKLDPHMTLFGRIQNLLDRRYEDPTGFLQPGLGVFAGIRLSWGGQ